MALQFLENFDTIFAASLERLGLALWVEITTSYPHCVYYFGPFTRAEEAKRNQAGYIEDLEAEGAQIVAVTVKRCQPKELTTCDGELPRSIESRLLPSPRSTQHQRH